MSLLSKVTKTAPQLPSRVYLYAQEKWGKTSWAAYAPNPIFVMSEGETGLLSLLEAGRIPETAHYPDDAKSWTQLQEIIRAIRDENHDHKTLVLDTANGCERLLQQHVCDTEFGGVMTGRDGYGSYGKGDLACVPHWVGLLRLLDEIRVKRRMSIILLAHSKIKAVNNPEGSDYDQLRPEGIDKLWTLTHKWADVIAAGTHDVFVKDDKVKNSKGRIIRTSGSVAVVAGNRYGLPEQIQCGSSAQSAWQAFAMAMQAAKAKGKKPEPPTNNPPKQDGNGGQPVQPAAPKPNPTPAVPARDREPGEDDHLQPGNEPEGTETFTAPPAHTSVPDGYEMEGEQATTAPRKPLPGIIAARLVEKMHGIWNGDRELNWLDIVPQLHLILGREFPDGVKIVDLTLEEASSLEAWLISHPHKKRTKAKAKVTA